MTLDAFIVLVILVSATVGFIQDRYPPEGIACAALIALTVSGILTVPEALGGFSNEATITVACMFVLSAGLMRSGALAWLGRWLIRFGTTRFRLTAITALTAGPVSAFINNTATVAVFLPLLLEATERHKISPSKLLIPLSYATQFAGVCTLIGTSTNLLVSSIAVSSGMEPLQMFTPTPLGIVLFGAGLLYLLLIAPMLLPGRRGTEVMTQYGLTDYLAELRVGLESRVAGQHLRVAAVEGQHGVRIVEVMRDEEKLLAPGDLVLQPGDILLVKGSARNLFSFREHLGLTMTPHFVPKLEMLESGDIEVVEALIPPNSRFIGETIAALRMELHQNALVLALHRRGTSVREKLGDIEIAIGDALLLLVRRAELPDLRREGDLILVERSARPAAARQGRTALSIVAAVVIAAAMGWVPIAIAALAGILMMVMTKVLTLDETYASINWRVVAMLAAMIPLGLAMQKSGLATVLVSYVVQGFAADSPWVALFLVYMVTAILTEIMSNNGTAVLLAPIAISMARSLEVDPMPFVMAVMFAASTAFSTPVGYQTNLMVYNAGGYRFRDFLRVGIPLNLLFMAIATQLIPRIWPF
ncbi:MAG: SLC13 family permease [Lysobacterales bacterium]|nr:SLC13 family permease [Xanthomonadales bacterium]MCB1610514.1 SLC13 family permease [Xanthomonadales bacterium]MCP5474375.1 SLC13 family permease [Rhodanobacteraceae bacterium]